MTRAALVAVQPAGDDDRSSLRSAGAALTSASGQTSRGAAAGRAAAARVLPEHLAAALVPREQAEQTMLDSWNCPIAQVVNVVKGTYCMIPKKADAAPAEAAAPAAEA